MADRRPIGDSDNLIGCMPWVQDTAMLARFLSLGATKTQCAYCDADVVISPEGRELERTEGVKPVCLECVTADARSSEIEVSVAPGIREAVRRATGADPEEIIPPDLSFGDGARIMKEALERRYNS